MGDPGKVAQILRILIDNARRYAEPGRPIRVAASSAAIVVENDGPPIAAEDAQLIFERFRRGAGHDGHAGFGLGLAIGRELARRMGGELRLLRRGAPTRFELALEPASPEALASAPELAEPAPQRGGRSPSSSSSR
jgi:signal transduction histidine kinase